MRRTVRLRLRPLRVTVAQPVERSPETRGVAGSIPAGHIARLRSSTRQSSRFLPGTVQVRRLPGPLLGGTATGAVSRLENGWASGPWGFDSLSFRSRVPARSRPRRATYGGMAELVSGALLARRRREPLAGSSLAASVSPSAGSSTGRAPLLQRGGWGFDSLAADSSPRSPNWQRRPAQTRKVRGSNPRGGTSVRRRSSGRTPGCYPVNAGSIPAVAARSSVV
jgi:hypothetical protein